MKPQNVKLTPISRLSASRYATAREATEAKAQEYAQWLANRDGLALPADGYKLRHDWRIAQHSTGNVKRVAGVAWLDRQSSEKLAEISIPNWDFEPSYVEEQISLYICPPPGMSDDASEPEQLSLI
jgi:hypothetical protein